MQGKVNIFIRTRMLGARVLQLARGAPKLIKDNIIDVFELAKKELEEGVLPFEPKPKKSRKH